MKRRILSLMIAMIMAVAFFTACASDGSTSDASDNSAVNVGDAASYDGKLEFDHAMELEYAKCFSVDYYKGG